MGSGLTPESHIVVHSPKHHFPRLTLASSHFASDVFGWLRKREVEI